MTTASSFQRKRSTCDWVRMRMMACALSLFWLLGSAGPSGFVRSGATAEPGASLPIEKGKADQMRARAQARELISGVLDMQLRRLAENGLGELAISRDIRVMRQHLEGLVENDMGRVVDVLVEAQSASESRREELFVDARQMIREIVLVLSKERQTLMKRLKLAELTQQVEQLKRLQTGVAVRTRELATNPRNDQASEMIRLIEDQRDIVSLYGQLPMTLAEVSQWEGALAATAKDGLKYIESQQVETELAGTLSKMVAAEYGDSLIGQAAVVEKLDGLLRLLVTAESNSEAGSQSPTKQVDSLIQQQQQLQAQTQALSKTPSTDAARQAELDRLAMKQNDLEKQIAKVAEQLPEANLARQALSQAAEQATTAAANLFQDQLPQAERIQSQMLAQLQTARSQLPEPGVSTTSPRSAAELASAAAQLEAAAAAIAAAKENLATAQSALSESSTSQPDRESRKELAQGAISKATAETAKALATNLLEQAPKAAQAATDAKQSLGEVGQELAKTGKNSTDAQSDSASAKRDFAADRAAGQLDEAHAEIQKAAQDLRERAAGAKLGELARATEALERVAAQQRQIANAASQEAKPQVESAKDGSKPSSTAEAMGALASQQGANNRLVEQLKSASQQLAPAAAEKLGNALSVAKTAEENFRGAANQSADAMAKSAETGASAAKQAAGELESAAQAARAELAAAARQIANEARQAAADLTANAVPVAAARNDLAAKLPTAAERLAEALAQTKAAAAAQQKLLDNPPSGSASQGAAAQQQADVARMAQQAAELAARDAPLAGQSLSAAAKDAGDAAKAISQAPADAASAQQSTADKLGVAQAALSGALVTAKHNEAAANSLAGEQLKPLANSVAPLEPVGAAKLNQAARQLAGRSSAATKSGQVSDPVGGPPASPVPAVVATLDLALAQIEATAGAQRQRAALAEGIASAASQQQSTANSLLAEAAQAAMPANAGDLGATQSQQAGRQQQLATAINDFAQQQRAVGSAAGKLAKQPQVGNSDLRQALKTASTPSVSGKPTGPDQGGAGHSGAGAAAAAGEMGQGFLPQSPEFTAAQMAGPAALAQFEQQAAQQAKANGLGADGLPNSSSRQASAASGQKPGEGKKPGEGQVGNGMSAGEVASETGSETPGTQPSDASRRPGKPTPTTKQGRATDANFGADALKKEAWFAKLPPEVRSALQSSGAQKFPRAYENRLKNYFQKSD